MSSDVALIISDDGGYVHACSTVLVFVFTQTRMTVKCAHNNIHRYRETDDDQARTQCDRTYIFAS